MTNRVPTFSKLLSENYKNETWHLFKTLPTIQKNPFLFPMIGNVSHFVKINLLIFNTFLVFLKNADAQKLESCGANFLIQKNFQHNPDLLERHAELDFELLNWVKNYEQNENRERGGVVITIPVVVHVVYQTSAENISDAQIRSQIDILNQDFRRRNANAAETPTEFLPFAADFEIEFCLANTDPTGKPTSGIVRRPTIWENVASLVTPTGALRVCYTSLGGSDAWDTKRYLNIWVARIGSGFLGMATFPGTAPASEDGVFVDPRYFGTIGLTTQYAPNNLGRTCVHEVGHFLNLKHIWGDGTNSCDDDDGVGDTPRQRSATVGCPNHPQQSCNSNDMFMNFMDYSSDACMNLFTQGQKARALAALQIARKNLFSQNGCTTVSAANQEKVVPLVQLFPNPALDFVQVDVPSQLGEPKQIFLSSVLGTSHEVPTFSKNEENWTLNVAELPSGVHFLHLIFDGKKVVLPFVRL